MIELEEILLSATCVNIQFGHIHIETTGGVFVVRDSGSRAIVNGKWFDFYEYTREVYGAKHHGLVSIAFTSDKFKTVVEAYNAMIKAGQADD